MIPAAVIPLIVPLVKAAIEAALDEVGRNAAVNRVEFNAARARALKAAMDKFAEGVKANG